MKIVLRLMKQMKKLAIPASIVVILILTLAAWFLFLKPANVYEAIPRSAVAIVEVNNWAQLYDKLGTTSCGIDLKKTEVASRLKNELSVLESILSGDKSLIQVTALETAVVSLHLTSAEDYEYLFTIPCKVSDNTLLSQLNASKAVRSVKMRTFRNQKVYDVALANGKQLTFATKKGIFIFSFTAFLTENAVTAILSGENIGSDKDFRAVRKRIVGQGDFKLFFNFKESGAIFPVFIKPDKNSLLSDVGHFAIWAAYSVALSNDEIKLTGIASSGVKVTSSASKNVLASAILTSIPDNAACVNISLNNLNAANENKMLAAYFKDWAGEAKAFITLEPLQEDYSDQHIFMLEVKDKEKAINDLKRFMKDDSPDKTVDTFKGLQIFSIMGGAGINRLFGNSFTLLNGVFVTVKNDVAIFCNNKDVLKFTVEKIDKGETLNKDSKYAGVAGHVSVNGVQYINPQRCNLLFQSLMKENSGFGNYLLQFSNIISESDIEGDLKGNTIILKAGGTNNPAGGLLWKTKLLAPSTFSPQIVKNVNTGDEGIFTQDSLGNIYLIGKSGEILFTKNIGDKIISNVYQVDYYHNDKLQYLFNTARHIYIVDRLGNFVASYPLRLSGVATAGLTLVHDEATNAYRYYIPCSNGSVYGYESTGKPLSGWSPRNWTGIISQPLICCNNGKASLILAFNNQGKLMAFDNKGALKWSVDNLPVAKQNFSLIKQGNDFVLLNATGNQLIEISADGNDNMKHLIDSASSFTATAISDSAYLYFFSNSTQIRAYNNKGEFKNAVSLNSSIISAIDIVQIGEAQFLQVTDDVSKKALLYDLALNLVAEFPYQNAFKITTLFDTKKITGIVADKEASISCYRIK